MNEGAGSKGIERICAHRIEWWLDTDSEETVMKSIYTQVRTIEEAEALGYFIVRNGYEGVQNDSYRYCRISIERAIMENRRHNRDFCYIGINNSRLVVGRHRRAMRRQGSLKFIEKERVFRKLLLTGRPFWGFGCAYNGDGPQGLYELFNEPLYRPSYRRRWIWN